MREYHCPCAAANNYREGSLLKWKMVQPWVFSDGLHQACCCRPAVLPAFSGLRKGSVTSVYSSYFLNHGFCCSMMPVDSKRTVVTWVKLTTNSYTCRSKSSCPLTGGASPFCVLKAVVAQGLNILGGGWQCG